MVPNLPLVETSNLWLVLLPVLAAAVGLGTWAARMETSQERAERTAPSVEAAHSGHLAPAA